MSDAETLMSAEVAEIPAAAARFLAESAEAVSAAAAAMRAADPRLLVTVARGSSDHAATYLKYAVELLAGVPVASVGPSVASIYGRQLRLDGAACLGISQSGASPDIVEMMRSARRRRGADASRSPTSRARRWRRPATHALPLGAGPGAERRRDQDLRRLGDGGAGARRRVARGRRTARGGGGAAGAVRGGARPATGRPLSDRLVRANSAFVLGRGPGFAIAAEMALKFKETCGIHAEAYSAAEVLHGPAAIVQAHFPVLGARRGGCGARAGGRHRRAARRAGRGRLPDRGGRCRGDGAAGGDRASIR